MKLDLVALTRLTINEYHIRTGVRPAFVSFPTMLRAAWYEEVLGIEAPPSDEETRYCDCRIVFATNNGMVVAGLVSIEYDAFVTSKSAWDDL